MAPNRGPVKASNKTSKGSKSSSSSKDSLKSTSKSRVTKPKGKIPPPVQQKTKRPTSSTTNGQKKKRQYTDKELGIPQLNMITPIGVAKPRGKKKGKVFVDDAESMMTILAIVNAEKEGQIESKMVKARQMEEIREARRREQEKREADRKQKLKDVKDGLRKKRLRKAKIPVDDARNEEDAGVKKVKKRVSFG